MDLSLQFENSGNAGWGYGCGFWQKKMSGVCEFVKLRQQIYFDDPFCKKAHKWGFTHLPLTAMNLKALVTFGYSAYPHWRAATVVQYKL